MEQCWPPLEQQHAKDTFYLSYANVRRQPLRPGRHFELNTACFCFGVMVTVGFWLQLVLPTECTGKKACEVLGKEKET